MDRREKGTGSVWYSEERKRWIAQFQVGILPSGKPKIRTLSDKTKKGVKDKLKAEQLKVDTGSYIDPSKLTVYDIATSINDNKRAMNIVGDSAYISNYHNINIIKKSIIGTIPIQKLSEPILTTFLSSLTSYSNSVIRKVYRLTNSALKRAVKTNLIKINPMEEIACPKSNKPTKKIRALTVEEQKKIIDAVNNDNKEPYRTMILLSMFTGMRMGEVGALALSDINIPFKTISISKTITRDEKGNPVMGTQTKTEAGMRIINMNSTVFALINDYIDNKYIENKDELLFIRKEKVMVSASNVNLYFKRLILRYHISDSYVGYNQHMLRHTFATRSIEAGMPPKVLQKILGHSDISITLNTYCDVFDNFETKYIEQTEQYLKENDIQIC